MVKRLGIAQAFLGRPEVILLDEPTAGLDPANARQIRDLIKQLQQQATIVVSSHNLSEVQELCGHVAILNHGNLVLTGSVDEITRADREYNLSLSRSLQNNEIEKLNSVRGVSTIKLLPQTDKNPAKDSAEYLITLNLSEDNINQDAVITSILRNILDMDIAPRKLAEGRSLETQFLEVTGGETEDS
jgi:ABC-2 type transport system ATP-binding protein